MGPSSRRTSRLSSRLAALAVTAAVALPLPGCASSGEPATGAGTTSSRALSAASTTTSAPTSTITTPTSTTTTTEPGPPDRPPELPDDPVDVARLLVEAEQAIRDPATPEVDLPHHAHLAQYAYRVLAAQPERDAEVRAVVPPDLLPAVDANLAARRELRGMHTHLLETLPAWRIVEPLPYDELVGYYQEAAAEFGVPWEYLAAIHLVETGTGRVDGTSVAGAQGPMQFMPATWESFGGGGDIHDHRDAIRAAAHYLRHSGAPGDMTAALFAYNRHYNYVRAIQHYASVIRSHPLAFRGYYHWQVYVLTVAGDVVLPVGFEEYERIPVEEYLARLGP